MKNFIRAIAYWVPSEDGSLLEFGGGLFGTATRFATATRALCFGRGEGLPAQAWERQTPAFLPDPGKASGFLRAGGAQDVRDLDVVSSDAAGPMGRAFTSGRPVVVEPMIAIPVASQGRITAVMALYF